MELKCAKCGSPKIVPSAFLPDSTTGSELKAVVLSAPDAVLFRGRVFAGLNARVCGECGFTEIFASNARELWEAHLKATAHKGTEDKTKNR